MGKGESIVSIRTDLRRLWAEADKLTLKALVNAGAIVERGAKQLVSTGAPKWRGPRGGVHYDASEPGKPPHVRTGALRASIAFAIDRDAAEPTVVVGPAAKYGKWLEFGTRHMAARPFMRPALRNTQDELLRAWR